MRSRKSKTLKSAKNQARGLSSKEAAGPLPEVDPGQILVLSDRGEPEQPQTVQIPLLPLRSDVVFPQTVVPLVVNRPSGIRLIDELMVGDRMVGLVTQRNPEIDDPTMNDLYPTVCVGSVLKMLKFPDGSTRVVCQGQYRARLIEVVQTEPYLIGRVESCKEHMEEGVELDALVHHINRLFQGMVDQSQQIPEELQVAAMNTREPGPPGRPSGIEPAVHDRGEAGSARRAQRPDPLYSTG